jgi:hypothetical protein
MKQLSVLFALSVLAGCTNESSTGAVEVALITVDSEGTVYRLPPYAAISVASETFHDSFALDGSGSRVRFDVPPGHYEVSFGEEGSQWPLERRVTGEPEDTVLGTLVTPMPIEIDVIEGGTARVQLSFVVPDRGTVTFEDTGEVAVSFDVSSATPRGYEVQTGALLWYATTNGAGVPESVTARFPQSEEANLPISLDADLAGDFVRASSDIICAPLAIASLSSSPTNGLQDLVDEVTAEGSTARICLRGDYATIDLVRRGEATTSTFQSTGDPAFYFGLTLYTHLGVSVYESPTLSLDALLDYHVVTLQVMGTVYGGESLESFDWSFRADYQGDEAAMIFGATY